MDKRDTRNIKESTPLSVGAEDSSAVEGDAAEGDAQPSKNPDPTTPAQDEDAVTPSTSGEKGQNTSDQLNTDSDK